MKTCWIIAGFKDKDSEDYQALAVFTNEKEAKQYLELAKKNGFAEFYEVNHFDIRIAEFIGVEK